MFGVAHAPWCVAHLAHGHMETTLVQSAGAAAPTLPASTMVAGTPTGDDSFALTLGRALENMPNPAQDGASITPKASPASPRGKGAASDSSDSSSMAGIFLTCFVTNLTQSASTVALSTEAGKSTASLQSPAAESTSNSPPNFASSLGASAGETSASTGTPSIPAAVGGVAATATLSAWAGKGVGPAGTAKPEASKSAARASGQVSIQSSGLVSKTGQNQSDDTAASPPVSTPAWFPGLQENSLLSQSAEQQLGGALSESKRVQASNGGSAQESGSRQQSQTSPNFTDSWPQLEQLDTTQMQTTPQSSSSQDLQAATGPTLAAGQTQQTASASNPEAGDSSTPVSALDHPELAEFSSLLGKFAGADADVKVTGTDSRPAGVTGNPATAGQASTEPPSALAGSPQNEFSPKSGNPVASPAKGTSHPAQGSSVSTLAGASPKVAEFVVANLRGPLPVAASITPTQHPDTTSPLTTPETSPRQEATAEATLPQPYGASPISVAAGATQANLSDQAANDERKFGQKGGTSTADNPSDPKPLVPGLANSTAFNSGTNLLSPHAPESPVSHANTSTAPPPPPASQPPATLAAWQNYESSTGKIVTSARLNESLNGAEMHVALRSASLGPVDVRAVVHEGSVGAEIRVEGREAHSLLAASLPALERALGERDLRVGNLTVYQDHVGGGMNGGEEHNPHSGSSPSPQRQVLPWETSSQRGNLVGSTVEMDEVLNPVVGLSVRA